jgi:hypothetical protein
LTVKAEDESQRQWDDADTTGLRFASSPATVEYSRDIQPILQRSCVACHTKAAAEPPGNLVLDDDDTSIDFEHLGRFPGTYFRLAVDNRAQFGHKPVGWDSWGYPQASRYIRQLQARRSLLVWKIFGRRLDGFSNDDHPSESRPGSGDLMHRGEAVDVETRKSQADIDYTGSIMPPPDAVASGKTRPLTDEDRLTITRWIDLGCPIDLDYDTSNPHERGLGWMLDDTRPTLSVTLPKSGKNDRLDRLLIGMHDYYSGLDASSFRVTADFAIDGAAAEENLGTRFSEPAPGVWELTLANPILQLPAGRLVVSIKDKQGNETRIVRSFQVADQ